MAIDKELLDQLLAGRDPQDVFARDGLLDDLKKALSERILNAELDDHLAGERADAQGQLGRPDVQGGRGSCPPDLLRARRRAGPGARPVRRHPWPDRPAPGLRLPRGRDAGAPARLARTARGAGGRNHPGRQRVWRDEGRHPVLPVGLLRRTDRSRRRDPPALEHREQPAPGARLTFHEDDSRIRNRVIVQNMALLRKIAINLVRSDKTSRDSLSAPRKMAAWNDTFMMKLLANQFHAQPLGNPFTGHLIGRT